ncbi:WXG100 family type VII secretion target [Actinoplanes sp. NPDC051851]|uniref:WXG100 family type VII secretion target n=1 Tax=Actinoplanes sp. NPDC051851 TaxID=3154753 RepID=UPI00342D471C
MVTTRAESAVLTATAARFDEVDGALQAMLGTLMAELSVLEGSWRGQGATAFEQVKTEYAADLRRLSAALAETAASIRAAGVGYEAADAGAAGRVTRAGGGLILPL